MPPWNTTTASGAPTVAPPPAPLASQLGGRARVDVVLTARTHALHAAVAEVAAMNPHDGWQPTAAEKAEIRGRVVQRATLLEEWLLRDPAGLAEPPLVTPEGGLPG